VRQLALLHFRNTITLNVKLEEALPRPRARVPPSIVQMLLVLQVHMNCKHTLFTILLDNLKVPAIPSCAAPRNDSIVTSRQIICDGVNNCVM